GRRVVSGPVKDGSVAPNERGVCDAGERTQVRRGVRCVDDERRSLSRKQRGDLLLGAARQFLDPVAVVRGLYSGAQLPRGDRPDLCRPVMVSVIAGRDVALLTFGGTVHYLAIAQEEATERAGADVLP